MEPEFLHKIGKEVPFEVPEQYFGKLNKGIMSRIGKEDELAGIHGAAAGNIFHVPPSYFEQLPGHIFARITGTEKSAGGKFTRFAQTAAAACFALLLSILSVIQVEKRNSSNDTFQNIGDFDEDMLVQEYLKTPVAETQSTDIETYILSQVDESLILQEL